MFGLRKMLRAGAGALLALGAATGCGSNSVTGTTGGNGVSGDVNSYLSDSLPSWSQFTADVNQSDQPPTPTGDPPDTAETVVPEVSQVEDDGSVTVVPDVTYRCVSTPYTLRSNPQQIVMYSPDVDILWPGALIQGKSRKELGSFLPLTIAERDSIKVSIPSFATSDNFRTVLPDQANVSQAIGGIVGNATQSGLSAPSTISFKMDTYNSEQEFGLSIGVSGHYLGFSASAQGDMSKSAGETTITAQFFQKMYEVVVAPPQTPGSFFSSDFTADKLQQQVSLGKIGPDNIPIYVSNVVYGRMMMFSMTSSASESDLRGTVQAGYAGLGGGVAGRVRAVLASYRPLAGVAEIRLHDTPLYNSIYLFDDDMLVNTHVYGILAAYTPTLRLRRVDGAYYGTYLESFERVWASARPFAPEDDPEGWAA